MAGAGLVQPVHDAEPQRRLATVAERVIEAEAITYLATMISSGYFAVLAMPADGNLGRARFAVHQMVERVKEEL